MKIITVEKVVSLLVITCIGAMSVAVAIPYDGPLDKGTCTEEMECDTGSEIKPDIPPAGDPNEYTCQRCSGGDPMKNCVYHTYRTCPDVGDSQCGVWEYASYDSLGDECEGEWYFEFGYADEECYATGCQ